MQKREQRGQKESLMSLCTWMTKDGARTSEEELLQAETNLAIVLLAL